MVYSRSAHPQEKIFWTRKMNIKLVNFIKSRPHIWNTNHPKYTSLAARDQTYAEFAAMYGDEFSPQAVKQRWTNIRSTFNFYLRKLKSSEAAGKSYTTNWHLWPVCQFLRNSKEQVNESTAYHEAEEESADEESNTNFNQLDLNNCLKDEKNTLSSHSEAINNSDIDCKSIGLSILNAFQNVQKDVICSTNTRNGQIGALVAEKLSQMSPFEAAQASCKIMEILLLYDDHNPNNPNGLP